MNILVINIGLILLAATQTYEHWSAIKPHISTFYQWCISADFMDVIAVLMVLGVAMSFLVSWGWY